MTQEEFSNRIIAMQATLYRVSTTILPQLCDREDAVQAAIEKAWGKQSSLREERLLRAWVIRILIHECYALLRRRKRESPVEVLPERETEPNAQPNLYRLFTSLEEKYRLPMVLFYVEGYSVEEIARMLRMPQGTLKSRLHRGRLLLRNTLDGEAEQE